MTSTPASSSEELAVANIVCSSGAFIVPPSLPMDGANMSSAFEVPNTAVALL